MWCNIKVDFLHFCEEIDDDEFHRMMSVDDLTYSIAFSDEVFNNWEWHTYAGLETCNVIKPTKHGKEPLGKSIQSTAKGDSSNSNLTYLSWDDIKLGTDHIKADVYVVLMQVWGWMRVRRNIQQAAALKYFKISPNQ